MSVTTSAGANPAPQTLIRARTLMGAGLLIMGNAVHQAIRAVWTGGWGAMGGAGWQASGPRGNSFGGRHGGFGAWTAGRPGAAGAAVGSFDA